MHRLLNSGAAAALPDHFPSHHIFLKPALA
jgi:hypothetical protein